MSRADPQPQAEPAGGAIALIGLGANLGDPARQLAEAVRRLGGAGQVVATSSLYRTAPVGGVDQPEFLNAVCALRTELGPEGLLAAMQAIEAELGRVREVRWGPRSIDLDLLDYQGVVRETPGLTLPHPEMHRRAFVLVPLAEVAPGWLHPVLGLGADGLLQAMGGAPADVVRAGPLGATRPAAG